MIEVWIEVYGTDLNNYNELGVLKMYRDFVSAHGVAGSKLIYRGDNMKWLVVK